MLIVNLLQTQQDLGYKQIPVNNVNNDKRLYIVEINCIIRTFRLCVTNKIL